jgi:hypothetical protein
MRRTKFPSQNHCQIRAYNLTGYYFHGLLEQTDVVPGVGSLKSSSWVVANGTVANVTKK